MRNRHANFSQYHLTAVEEETVFEEARPPSPQPLLRIDGHSVSQKMAPPRFIKSLGILAKEETAKIHIAICQSST